jgi:hypothetical protein
MSRKKTSESLLYDFWFPKSATDIIIVTSEENSEKKSVDARTTSENYSFLDNVGDRDALISAGMFLARHYPKAKIKHLFPRTFHDKDDSSANLLVIGGPKNNALCKRLMARIASQVSYSLDDWTMCVGDTKYSYDHDDIRGMRRDLGYFACFQNHLNTKNRIVLVNGINTFGVVGALQAFSDLALCRANFSAIEAVARNSSGSINFECFFEVSVQNCETLDCTKVVVDPPSVELKNVFVVGGGEGKSQRLEKDPVQGLPHTDPPQGSASSKVRGLLKW